MQVLAILTMVMAAVLTLYWEKKEGYDLGDLVDAAITVGRVLMIWVFVWFMIMGPLVLLLDGLVFM